MRKFTRILISVALVTFVSTVAKAMETGDVKFGLGIMPINVNGTSTSTDGSVAMTSAIAYPFIAQGYFRVLDQTFVSPRLAYTAIP